MTINSDDYLVGLVKELVKLPSETEWVEFKKDNNNPELIGKYISGLANTSALLGKTKAYVLWGISDDDHEIIGTNFKPETLKVKGEEIENWLLRLLKPKINFKFFSVSIKSKYVVVLEIEPAVKHPVKFMNQEYIRIGSYNKNMNEFPEKERALWRALEKIPFEKVIARENVSNDDIMRLLDYPTYFELLNLNLPDGHKAILDVLESDGLINKCLAGGYNITNLGAILFAKNINDFPNLKRKALRVIQYKGKNRIETQREQVGTRGYASGFEGLIDFITALIPSNEFIGKAIRSDTPMYPDIAIRELVANALIHQDFFETGTGPMIEIFDDRMEITNPGKPLVSVERFLDTAPKSRNESLASIMRRFGICEERGSGIDKVVFHTELFQLPAPLFEVPENSTRTVLFSHKDIEEMDREDRIRACYLHACLQYVQREKMTNKTLRDRFGLDGSKGSMVSRIITAALDSGLIIQRSTSKSKRDTTYVPFWSSSRELND